MGQLWKLMRRLFKTTSTLLILGLFLLNILTVTSFKMFDIVSSLVRMATVPVVSLFDEGRTKKRPTWGEAINKSDDLEKQNRLNKKEINDLDSRNKKLTSDLDVSAKRRGELELDLAQTKKRNADQVAQLKSNNKKLTSDLNVSAKRRGKLELDLAQTKTRNTDEVAQLFADNKKLKKKIAGQVPVPFSKAVRGKVKKRIRSLMRRISRSTALEVSSAPAELSSIGPGTFVALGLLVYEVRDTCLQMGELKELYDLVSMPGESEDLVNTEMDSMCGLSTEDLTNLIFSKTPQELCTELRLETQQVDIAGCEEFPIENTQFEAPNLDETENQSVDEVSKEFLILELD